MAELKREAKEKLGATSTALSKANRALAQLKARIKVFDDARDILAEAGMRVRRRSLPIIRIWITLLFIQCAIPIDALVPRARAACRMSHACESHHGASGMWTPHSSPPHDKALQALASVDEAFTHACRSLVPRHAPLVPPQPTQPTPFESSHIGRISRTSMRAASLTERSTPSASLTHT